MENLQEKKFKIIFPEDIRFHERFNAIKVAAGMLPDPKSIDLNEYQVPIQNRIGIVASNSSDGPSMHIPQVVKFIKVKFERRDAWEFKSFD